MIQKWFQIWTVSAPSDVDVVSLDNVLMQSPPEERVTYCNCNMFNFKI